MPTKSKQPKESKTHLINMRVSTTEKQMLRKVADKMEAKSVSDAIRQMARREIKRK